MARRRETASEPYAAEAPGEMIGVFARYVARIYGLGADLAVMEMSDAELRTLAEQNPDNPGAAAVLRHLDDAQGLEAP